jgi:hypothetical protein
MTILDTTDSGAQSIERKRCCTPLIARGKFRGGTEVTYWLHGVECVASIHRRVTLSKRAVT